MGKIDIFSISLQKQTPIYFSGEPLVGLVSLRVKERLKINSVKLLITGGARVHWSNSTCVIGKRTESHGTGKNRTTRHYSAIENYLSFNLVFICKQPNSDLYLEVGDYSYPFSVVLPQNLPTSFEHTYGRVRYSINATVDIPWAFDKNVTKSFSVVSQLDLNNDPSYNKSYGLTDQKVICCGPCKSDPIEATFHVNKIGFVPGETVKFNVTIDNRSSREIKEMTVNLIQNIKFFATTKSRLCSRNVASLRYHKKIEQKTSEVWNDSALVIPPVCSSSTGMCKIINVSYSLVFNFDASGMAISKDMKIPIVIGTIPIRAEENVHHIDPSLPTYEACMFGSNLSKDIPPDFEHKGEIVESDQSTYKPIYPYYRDFSN